MTVVHNMYTQINTYFCVSFFGLAFCPVCFSLGFLFIFVCLYVVLVLFGFDFISCSQEIGREECLQNDLFCVLSGT